MRISDWSSDVCSSDLALFRESIDWAVRRNFPPPGGRITLELVRGTIDARRPRPLEQSFRVPEGYRPPNEEFAARFLRSEERRVGHECVSACRSRGSQYH